MNTIFSIICNGLSQHELITFKAKLISSIIVMLIRQTDNDKYCMSKMLQTFLHARKLVCHEKSHIAAHKWKKTELRNRTS